MEVSKTANVNCRFKKLILNGEILNHHPRFLLVRIPWKLYSRTIEFNSNSSNICCVKLWFIPVARFKKNMTPCTKLVFSNCFFSDMCLNNSELANYFINTKFRNEHKPLLIERRSFLINFKIEFDNRDPVHGLFWIRWNTFL